MKRIIGSMLTAALVSLFCATSHAGMPMPLPTDFETASRLTATTESRLQAISFFVVVLLVAAFCVKLLWNGVQKDFPQLPRMRFFTAIKAVVLWGLVCVVVLTMIAGARELMTPGAWVKKGATYKLAAEEDHPGEKRNEIDQRLARLADIGDELLGYVAHHDDTFPDELESAISDPSLLEVPGHPGQRYRYGKGGDMHGDNAPLVYEPELDSERRFVLMKWGTIQSMTTDELNAALESKEQP